MKEPWLDENCPLCGAGPGTQCATMQGPIEPPHIERMLGQRVLEGLRGVHDRKGPTIGDELAAEIEIRIKQVEAMASETRWAGAPLLRNMTALVRAAIARVRDE